MIEVWGGNFGGENGFLGVRYGIFVREEAFSRVGAETLSSFGGMAENFEMEGGFS